MQNDTEFEAPEEGRTGWGVSDFRALTPEKFAEAGMPNIVYVREVLAADLRANSARRSISPPTRRSSRCMPRTASAWPCSTTATPPSRARASTIWSP